LEMVSTNLYTIKFRGIMGRLDRSLGALTSLDVYTLCILIEIWTYDRLEYYV